MPTRYCNYCGSEVEKLPEEAITLPLPIKIYTCNNPVCANYERLIHPNLTHVKHESPSTLRLANG